jgi:hypothetical protein
VIWLGLGLGLCLGLVLDLQLGLVLGLGLRIKIITPELHIRILYLAQMVHNCFYFLRPEPFVSLSSVSGWVGFSGLHCQKQTA